MWVGSFVEAFQIRDFDGEFKFGGSEVVRGELVEGRSEAGGHGSPSDQSAFRMLSERSLGGTNGLGVGKIRLPFGCCRKGHCVSSQANLNR